MRNTLHFIAIFTALALIAGCNDRIATLKVTGTITYDGEPLAGASVNFSPKTEGEGNPGYAVTDANGRYTLQTLAGAADAGTTPGTYLVTVGKMEQTQEVAGGGGADTTSARPPDPRSLIPIRYNNRNTSGLEATVERGAPNVFDFDLKSQ